MLNGQGWHLRRLICLPEQSEAIAFLSLPPQRAKPAKPQTHRGHSSLELIVPKRAQSIRPPPGDFRPRNKLLARLPAAASCECYSTVKGHFDRLGL